MRCVLNGGGPGDGRVMAVDPDTPEVRIVVKDDAAARIMAVPGRPSAPGLERVHMLVARYVCTGRFDAEGRLIYHYRR